MTPAEAVAKARKQGHIVMIHRGEVFINTFDWTQAQEWGKAGAKVVPHFTLEEIESRKRKGKHTSAAWEVHLLGACDGDNLSLLAAAREHSASAKG